MAVESDRINQITNYTWVIFGCLLVLPIDQVKIVDPQPFRNEYPMAEQRRR